jgi:hypothetical protein
MKPVPVVPGSAREETDATEAITMVDIVKRLPRR